MHDTTQEICSFLSKHDIRAEIYASGRAYKFWVNGRQFKIRIREKQTHYEVYIGDHELNKRSIPKDSDWLHAFLQYTKEAQQLMLQMMRLQGIQNADV